MVPHTEDRKQKGIWPSNQVEPHGNEQTDNIDMDQGNSIDGGFLRNMFRKKITMSVEEASAEYAKQCIRRENIIENIAVENTCEVHWMYGFLGEPY